MWSELMWFMWRDFILKWSEVRCDTVKFLGTEVPRTRTLGWPYTEGTWLYCDHFIWCVSCTVVVWTGFVMCGSRTKATEFSLVFSLVGVLVICVLVFTVFLYCLYCVFVVFRLCVFILICFVCTGVRTTATGWQLNCSK